MVNTIPPAPPPYQPQGPANNPYDFITNPGNNSRQSLLSGSKNKRIMIVAVFAAVLITIALIFVAILSSSGDGLKAEYTKLAREHAEIVRVSEIGVSKARSDTAKNLAVTTNLSMTSSQADIMSIAGKGGAATDKKSLALGSDTKIDTALTQAEQTNRFDEVFIETIHGLLSKYQKTVKNIYNQSSKKQTKETLNQAHMNAQLLLAIGKKE